MLQLAAVGACLVLCLPFAVFAGDPDRNACQGDSNQWKQLFDGKDLNGWKHVGPGHMTVENGLIQSHGGMGLLYWTGGKIGNCAVRVVFRMRDENDNSGVFIRIPVEPLEEWMPVHYGFEVQIDNHPERGNPPEDDHTLNGNVVFDHQTAGQGLEAVAAVEHDGDHTRWTAHNGGSERGESERLQGRRPCTAPKVRLRAAAGTLARFGLLWAS